jgi:hypothetical protein
MRIHRTTFLSVVLYWCETWCLTLKEEHRLRVFEESVLRRIFGHLCETWCLTLKEEHRLRTVC